MIRISAPLALIGGIAVSLAAPTLAGQGAPQDSRTSVYQIGDNAGTSDKASAGLVQPEQIGTASDAPPEQLYRGPSTAQPASPLSTPAQGRVTTATPLSGHDSCDPARNSSKDPTCRRAIEKRADEFVHADGPTLTPEQRLLVQQRLREGAPTTKNTLNRLAADNVDPESLADQAIASQILKQPAEPAAADKQPDATTPENAAALVEAIVNAAPGTTSTVPIKH